MKKLLFFMLVLGLTSFAQAGLVFTIDGVEQPAEITLMPSEYVELDLELPTGSILGYDITYQLTPYGDVPGDAELITTGYGDIGPIMFIADFDIDSTIVGTPTAHTVEITGSNLFSPLAAPQTIMLDLVLHCLGEGDVLLEVISMGGTTVDDEQIPPDTVMHTLLIHQIIPEPMTVALLGLGGLFALRRKKR